MLSWAIAGYIGIFFAAVYRIPQITKIYRTKKGDDLSKKAFLLHNGAYIAFIVYLTNNGKPTDYVLLSYYGIGITQNLMIVGMKEYYKWNEPGSPEAT